MSRPRVSVVMPFAGDTDAARAALATLQGLAVRPADELILVGNGESLRDSLTGSGKSLRDSLTGSLREPGAPGETEVTVLAATAERSPAHARNFGAERATGDWILFLDADCRAPRDLVERYFETPVAPEVGALAGEVTPASDPATLAARYGAARSFLGQEAHLAHPYLPRAVAANLLVRRHAFTAVGGFTEGVRAAEDTDFSWRLQRAGWRLELRPEARVEHAYRTTLGELRRQWRGYAAGRAWLARRYAGFTPEPAVRRALRRGVGQIRLRRRASRPWEERSAGSGQGSVPALDRGRYLAIDALLAAEELRGLLLSNRPAASGPAAQARVVVVAERFPARGDPLVDFVATLEGARVEAAARPEAIDPEQARELRIAYREDDGAATRIAATLKLAGHHPLRVARQLFRPPGPREIGVAALAPAAVRLEHEAGVRLHALGGQEAQAAAQRLAALSGRPLGSAR